MEGSTRRLVLIWLATTAAVAISALVGYRSLVRVPELAGRTGPETLLDNPEALFEDPGLLGTAVEISVTRAIASCMESRGFEYRGPAEVSGLDDTLDPSTDGYGISTGPAGGAVTLGNGGVGRYDRDAYEHALYGSSLDGGGTSGGCAAAGAAELEAALIEIEALPYSIKQLEADAIAHPAMVAGMSEWSACMAGRGYTADTPIDLIADIVDRLSRATPAEALALAEEEKATAVADFECRDRYIEPAFAEAAEDLAPAFVEANREQLEDLMPPERVPFDEVTVPTDLGTGDVQVTLLWTAGVDLDLRVTDPGGASIDYSNRSSTSGGQLDRDANRSCGSIVPDPVENVFWPEGMAPRGVYTVRVTQWSNCSVTEPVEFTIIVTIGGRQAIRDSQTFDGTYTTEFQY